MNEWISVCGVRFWGQSQIQEGIWMSRGLGTIFFLSAAMVLALVVRIMIQNPGDWLKWFFGPALLVLAVVAGYTGFILFSDAACYAAWSP